MKHQNLQHFDRYDAHRPYAVQRKLTTRCAQVPLCDGNDNESDSSDGRWEDIYRFCFMWNIMYVQSFSVFIFTWFNFNLLFPRVFPSNQALVFFCSLQYSCWETRKCEDNTKVRMISVAFFADKAGPFSTHRQGNASFMCWPFFSAYLAFSLHLAICFRFASSLCTRKGFFFFFFISLFLVCLNAPTKTIMFIA